MLSKKPAADPRPSANGPMAGSTFSVIGPDVEIKGDLKAQADLHIDGKVDGDISCATLVQGEASEIIGLVTAETARIAIRSFYGYAEDEELIERNPARRLSTKRSPSRTAHKVLNGHEMQMLFAALRENEKETSRFFGTVAGTVPVQDFYSPENISRIVQASEFDLAV